MGILHEMLAKIHLAHDNALAMADPEAVKTQAHHGFFAEVANLVHALEARVMVIEHSLFGEPEQEPQQAQPEVAENTGSGAAPVAPQPGEASDSAATTSAAAGTATPSA
jgi:hypothetical protein